jgi:hypothetical protein
MKSNQVRLSGIALARRLLSFLARHARVRKLAKRVMYRLPWARKAVMELASDVAQDDQHRQKTGVEGAGSLSEPAKIIYQQLVNAYRIHRVKMG